jgi:hypothetical protein
MSTGASLSFYLAPCYDLAALIDNVDERPLLAVSGEPDGTETVRELLTITPGRLVGGEIESPMVLDLATVNDVIMVE